jgi:hypothetical protein
MNHAGGRINTISQKKTSFKNFEYKAQVKSIVSKEPQLKGAVNIFSKLENSLHVVE